MSRQGRLPLSVRLSYGVGEMAEGVKSGALETFLFFYYVQVLGLPGTLAGLALLLAVLFDAVTDPLIGHLSDNIRSRFGRRHPFLYAAPIPLAIGIVLLFHPPAGFAQTGLFLWLLVFTLISRLMQSFYFVPHMALGADLTQDYEERIAMSGWRNAFAYVGRLLVLGIAFSVFFAPSEAFPNGQTNPAAYGPFAIACAVIAASSILFSAFGTQREVLRSGQACLPASAMPDNILSSTLNAFRLPAFSIFFTANLISYVLSGVQGALSIYLMTYYWRLPPHGLQWVLSSLTIGILIGSLLVRSVSVRWDKKPLLVLSVILSVLIAILPIGLAEMRVLPVADKQQLILVLVAFQFAAGLVGGAALVLPGAILADIADAYADRFGQRTEGFIYGASAFTRKAALGMGGAIAGVALDVIRFPRGAEAADVDPASALNLALLYGPAMLVLTLFAMAIMWQYPLDRKTHAQILERLRQKGISEP
jgi:GPH family glycoside/pentoside/hexuronide:cation symporter